MLPHYFFSLLSSTEDNRGQYSLFYLAFFFNLILYSLLQRYVVIWCFHQTRLEDQTNYNLKLFHQLFSKLIPVH